MNSSENAVYDVALGYQKTAALIAAVKLDIFTLIGNGNITPDVLSFKTGASVRGLRILCDYLTVIGLLSKRELSYSLSPAARRYLDRSSPAAMGSCIAFLAAPEMISLLLDDPVSYVRHGGSKGLANLAPDHPIWVRFAHAMIPFAAPTAKLLSDLCCKLARKASHRTRHCGGSWPLWYRSGEIAAASSVTAVDWAEVLSVARMNAEAAGVQDRLRMIAGSAFDVDWGRGFDLVLLANFLHHLAPDECILLLRKLKSSLSPTGQVLAVDFVPNPDRVSPPLQAMFSFWMLASTPHGEAHTVGDLDEMARRAGFEGVTSHSLDPTPERLLWCSRIDRNSAKPVITTVVCRTAFRNASVASQRFREWLAREHVDHEHRDRHP